MANHHVTLELLKAHLRVDDTEEDNYLEHLIEVAETSVEKLIQRPLDDKACLADDGTLAAPLRHGILLVAANLYENREPVAYANARLVPYTLHFLFQPYKLYE